MAIDYDTLMDMLQEAFDDAQIELVDLVGDGDHYQATIISKQFQGLSKVKQHQLVYGALKGKMGNDLHALALKTSAL